MTSPSRDIQTSDISEFQNELERKDLIIKNLKQQLSNLRENKIGGAGDYVLISDLKSENARKEKEIQNLKEEMSDLKNELKETKTKLNCYELKDNFNKNESNNLLEISQMKIDQISKDKGMLEDKIKQLVDIIKQYCNELNDSSLKIKSLSDNIFALQNENRKLIEAQEVNKQNMIDFQNNMNKYNKIIMENNNNKNIINNLNKELLEYKNDYNKEINNNKLLNEKIISLVNKCSEYEMIQKACQDANNDLVMAKKQINEINMRNQENENFINSLYSDVNENISLLIDYISKNFDIKNKPKTTEENISNFLIKIDDIKFDQLFEILENKRKEILNFSNDIQNGIQSTDNSNKNLINENLKLKEDINNYICENKKLNSENIKLNNIINNINTDMINAKNSNELLKQKLNDINFEKNEINNKLMNEVNINKNMFEGLKEDNANLIILNNNIQEELNKAKIKLSENDKINANLKLNCQILEKKIKNLQTEIDLKNIQIKNQEEIINRRNDNNNSNILENDSILIKKLKTDRDNLINDNVLLINQNNLLRQQLNEFTGKENQQDNVLNTALRSKIVNAAHKKF